MQDEQQNEPGAVIGPEGPEGREQEAPVAQPTPSSASFQDDGSGISWTASEFSDNHKPPGWFGLLIVGSVVLAVVVYIIADLVSALIILVLGALVGVFANHKPRSLEYRLDDKGLHIAEKFYPYSTFKSFSIIHEQAMGYISLMPVRRFMPPLSVYYPPEDEQRIGEVLSDFLPFEEHKQDVVDRITRKIRL